MNKQSVIIIAAIAAVIGFFVGRSGLLMSPEQQGRQSVKDAIAFQRGAEEQGQAELKKARQHAVLTDARMIGVALVMYAQDSADWLPPNDDAKWYLSGYLKKDNPTAFDPLGDVNPEGGPVHLTITGKQLKGLPHNTVVGYKVGPDCEADIFADGRVKWQVPPP